MTTRTTSAFLEKGVVTPEEFVVAGDYLVEQCPTWSWQGGDAKSAKSYLPEDKQFLVTRNVPCLKRARAMEEYAGKEEHLSGEDEGWVAAGGDGNGGSKDDDAPDMDEIPDISALRVDSGAKDDKNDDDADIPDMDDFDMCGDDELLRGDHALLEERARGARGHQRLRHALEESRRWRGARVNNVHVRIGHPRLKRNDEAGGGRGGRGR